jgi:hypothetical protein
MTLRENTIHILYTHDRDKGPPLIQEIEEANPGVRWPGLDLPLLKLWESHSIQSNSMRPKSGIR